MVVVRTQGDRLPLSQLVTFTIWMAGATTLSLHSTVLPAEYSHRDMAWLLCGTDDQLLYFVVSGLSIVCGTTQDLTDAAWRDAACDCGCTLWCPQQGWLSCTAGP
jgi:hypothetical protein